MPENVILNFEGDPSGLKPVADALTALGQLTDQQQKDFAQANADYKKQMEANAAAVKNNVTALGQMSNGVKGIAQTIAGGAIKEGTKDLQKFSTELINAGKQSTSLKSQLRAIKAELATMADEGAPEFQKLSIEAAKLEDKIGDVNERIRVLASDTFAFDAVVGAARGVAAGFAVAQGAAALFGKESEDVQKALLKVNAAMAILTGLQEVANIVTGQGAAKLAVLSAAKSAYAFVTSAATVALKAFRVALLGTGIGAIVFVLYEAASAMGLFTEKVTDNNEALEKQKAAQEAAAEAAEQAAKERLSQIAEYQKQVLELTKTEKERLAIDVKSDQQRKAQLEELLKVYISAGAQIQELQKELSNGINIDFFEESGQGDALRASMAELGRIQEEERARIDADLLLNELAAIDASIEANKKGITKLNEDEKKAAEEAAKALLELEQKKYDNKMALLNQFIAETEGAKKDELEKEKQRLDTEFQLYRDNLDKKTQEYNEWSAKMLDLIKEQATKELEAQQKKEDQKKQITEAVFQAISMVVNEAFAQQQQAIQDTLNAELNALNKKQQAILSNESLTATQREAIQKQFEQKEKEAKRNAFIADRNAKVEQALINGLLSFSLALATIPPPGGAITGAISLALAGVQAGLIASRPVPEFREGTEFLEGPGTGTSDSIHIRASRGERIVDAATNAKLKGISNDMLPKLAMYADMLPNIPDSLLQQFERNQSSTFDYKMIGDAFAERLAKNPMLQVSIDKNGVGILFTKGNMKVNYLNSKFKG